MIELRDIGKNYLKGEITALSDVSVAFGDCGLVAICGPAACGKSTLLNILGGIEQPDSGEVIIDGKSTRTFREADWNEYRNARVGFAFQDPVFVGHRTALENVELALTIGNVRQTERSERALEALRLLGVENCASKKPAALSSAQQRLVAIARTLAKQPDILLADEPTCGLDKNSAETVVNALERAARSRLVILATSDDELASRASRILRFANGKVVSDVSTHNGTVVGTIEQSAKLSGKSSSNPRLRAKSRRSMPFFAVVGYSIRNISAKKGRAILTAIASAISMIGIATIVALGGGANNLIAGFEESSIATDPIVIGKSNLDLTSLLSSESLRNLNSQSAATEESSSSPGTAKVNTLDGSIQDVSSMLAETISHVRDNDLAGFKQFVDSDSDSILDYVDTVTYDYGIVPLIYNGDTTQGVEQLNPSSLSEMVMRRANSTASSLNSLGGFHQMIDSQDILDEQMDVVYGTWPQSYDECVIVLDKNGGISDLTLYYLGLYDHEAVNDALNAALDGQSVEFPDSPSELSYDQLMDANFVVLPRVSLYQRDEARGTWADKSLDDDYVAGKIAQEGIKLKVCGIVQPKRDTPSPLMPEGVGYTSELVDYLVGVSAQSAITKQQLDNPDVDVFTGKSFEELKAHPAGNLDLENVITVNDQAIARLLGMFGDSDVEETDSGDGDLELLWADLSKIDWSQFEIDERDILDAINEQRIYDAIELASMLDPEESGLELTAEQKAEVSILTGGMVANFTAWAIDEGATAEDLSDSDKVSRYWKGYLQTDVGKQQMLELDLLVGQSYGEVVRGQLEDYLTGVYVEVLIYEVSAEIIEQSMEEIAKEAEEELEREFPAVADELGRELEAAIANELDRILTEVDNGVAVVGNELGNVIQINMSEEDLVAFLNNLSDSSEIGYDNNMAKLGYADMSKPLSMSIYPKDLAAKQKVIGIITAYNDRMDQAGMHDRTIIYNNNSGDMSETLSGVVDIVGLVLIVLIGVSLIVGSIMLALLTYTGIAERRREMGLLRSLGASRGNLVAMFNIETFVEGLLAGVIAVGVVYAMSAGVNSMTATSFAGVDVMVLSPQIAAALIVLSGVLPLLVGLAPSFVVSCKRPARFLSS